MAKTARLIQAKARARNSILVSPGEQSQGIWARPSSATFPAALPRNWVGKGAVNSPSDWCSEMAMLLMQTYLVPQGRSGQCSVSWISIPIRIKRSEQVGKGGGEGQAQIQIRWLVLPQSLRNTEPGWMSQLTNKCFGWRWSSSTEC